MLGLGLLAIAEMFRENAGTILRVPRAPIILIGILVSYVWIQLFLGIGIFVGDALLVSMYLSGLGIAISLGHRYAAIDAQDVHLRWIFVPLAVAALLSAGIGFLQWLDLEGWLGMYALEANLGDRPMGNMGQPNQLATLTLLGLVSFAWLYSAGFGGRLLCAACVVFLTLVLALTQSRAGVLGAVTASIFLACKGPNISRQLSAKWFLVWLVAYGLLLLFVPTLYDLINIEGGRSTGSALMTSDRYAIWRQVLAAIAQAPWLGYGWSQTPSAQAVGSLSQPGAILFTYAHNIVLDMVLWNGIPVGLMISGSSACWLLARMYSTRQGSSVYALAALIPILGHSFVEFPFAYSYFLLTAGLLVGVIEAGQAQAWLSQRSLRLHAIGLVAWISIGLLMIFDYFRAETDYRMTRLVNQKLELRAADYEPPVIIVLTQLGALLAAMRIEPTPNMRMAELEVMRTTLARFSNREVHLNYILALGLNQNPTEAIRQLTILREMYGIRSLKVAQFVLRQWEKTYPELALVQVAY